MIIIIRVAQPRIVFLFIDIIVEFILMIQFRSLGTGVQISEIFAL
jgi:hypothetical protein